MKFDSFREKANLLTLPIETRFMIYDLIINPTGSLIIYSQYEMSKSVDEETMHLLHVNRLIRAEIHEYFYKNQTFEFRSFPAMEKFLDKIGAYYASIIKNVVIGSWLAQRAAFAENIGPFIKRLTGIECLTIQAPAHGFVTDWSDQAEVGDKAIAVFNASERLGAGKLHLAWVDYYGYGVMQFVAPNIAQPSNDNSSFRKLFMGIFQDRYYHWQSLGILYSVEVKDPNRVPGTSGNQKSRREAKTTIYKLVNDDDLSVHAGDDGDDSNDEDYSTS